MDYGYIFLCVYSQPLTIRLSLKAVNIVVRRQFLIYIGNTNLSPEFQTHITNFCMETREYSMDRTVFISTKFCFGPITLSWDLHQSLIMFPTSYSPVVETVQPLVPDTSRMQSFSCLPEPSD